MRIYCCDQKTGEVYEAYPDKIYALIVREEKCMREEAVRKVDDTTVDFPLNIDGEFIWRE